MRTSSLKRPSRRGARICIPGTSRRQMIRVHILVSKARIQQDTTITVLPAKSDSDFMFVNKVIRNFQTIDHLCQLIKPIHMIGLIHK